MKIKQLEMIVNNDCQNFIDYIRKQKGDKDFSFIPVSIWDIPNINLIISSIVKDENIEIRKEVFVKGAYKDNPKRFSEFKPDVALRCLEYYGFTNCNTLDPFMGRATRGVVSALLGQNYIGLDISPKVVDWANDNAFKIVNNFLGEERAKGVVGDGCLLKEFQDRSIDLIFTCPPYWNLEIYDDEVENELSHCYSYKNFLERLTICSFNCFRVLKEGGFAVFVVGDWKREGIFYHFGVDLINIFEKIGFYTHDIGINRVYSWLSSILTIRQNQKYRYLGKIHEYIIVFRKVEKSFAFGEDKDNEKL